MRDANELDNIAESEAVQIAQMRQFADAQEQLAKTGAFESGEAELSHAEREALCNLGYIDCD